MLLPVPLPFMCSGRSITGHLPLTITSQYHHTLVLAEAELGECSLDSYSVGVCPC